MREISQGPTPLCRTTENPRLLRENYISSWIRSLAWIMLSLITWNIFYRFFLHSLFVGFYIQLPSASSGGWISGFCSPFPAQVPVSTSMGPSVNLSEGVCKTNNFTIGKTCSPVFPRGAAWSSLFNVVHNQIILVSLLHYLLPQSKTISPK